VAAELRGSSLTEERLIAETLGATSHRRNMRIGREPIRVKVVRENPPVEEVVEIPVEVAEPMVEPEVRPQGMLSSVVAAVRDWWRRLK
jgi:hypothetical protein